MSFDISAEAGVEDEVDEGVAEVEFARSNAYQLYEHGAYGTHPMRWERVRTELSFEDIVAEFEGERRQVISCPFHGRDSKPSFHLYKATNDAFCFGCPEGSQYYDAIRFVAAKMGFTREQSLRWLEKHYDLPPIADLDGEVEELEEDLLVSLTFTDLAGPYISHASRDIHNTKDVELAEDYLRIFFEAQKAGTEGDPLPLARVLGPAIVKSLLSDK